MPKKADYLQIRVTTAEKAALRRAALRAGQSMSAFVLGRLLPPGRRRFGELLTAAESDEERSYALAELNDLLTELAAAEMAETLADPPQRRLSPYLRNYIAAMVEQAAHQKRVAPPAWTADVEPLEKPHFVKPLAGLRLHLLVASPVPFRRRNIFVDSAVGDRV